MKMQFVHTSHTEWLNKDVCMNYGYKETFRLLVNLKARMNLNFA